ncbi:kinesin heavy chain-like [Zootermopsis nevadensis]|uniref:Kinesin-like protein n=1 Tax=Zootermopsis nevadensis TaxID=136037 RepID=A0A067R2F8_ZOONE|nr:kinesin heavy chain-like [Zootermopsis nevadensis]KDR17204.1 Kinesin-like protein kif7 [Zootermopsis nevadensis]
MDVPVERVLVAVRVRPLSDKENKKNAFSVVQALPHEPKVLSVAGKGYAFDHIFTDICEQASVYEESVRPLVKKFCAGFNCAVITYGHTGTGKTYTIGTDSKLYEDDSAGIISRVVKDILSGNNTMDSKVMVEISFMEIYNEEVYDLLTCQPTKLIVQVFSVQSLKRMQVTTYEEVLHHLEFGGANRHTRATALNAHSSRSHAIFTVYYHQIFGDHTVQSRLDLVDLAGSEGVRHTGSRGVALNEAKNINTGLLHLRNVISVLSKNTEDHIPYRSSTLTTVLKDSLSRESCVTVIVCISPSNLDITKTVTTLQFAEEAKKVMSKPKVKEILDKYKTSNPEAFKRLTDMAPTPVAWNKYKGKSTPVPRVRKPFTPLNTSNVSSFSSADMQDCFKKPFSNRLDGSHCSSSASFLSEMSTSTALDTSSALSPLIKKDTRQMEQRLDDTVGTSLYTGVHGPSVRDGNHLNQSSTPMQQTLDRTIVEVQSAVQQSRFMLRNDLKMFADELKAYVHDQIALHSCQTAPGTVTTSQQENVHHKVQCLPDETPRSHCAGSVGECTISHTQQQQTVKRVSRLMKQDLFKKPSRRSIRIANQHRAGPIGCISTPQDQHVCSPSIATMVRRSERLSIRLASHNRDKLSLLSPSLTSTVYRRSRFSGRPLRPCIDEISKLNPSKGSPPGRKSARLLGRTPGYPDESLPRLSSSRSRRVSYKPALMASPPEEFDEKSFMKAQDKFKQKALKLINGSLKDLTNFSIVGPKTAIIIYNYRLLMNDCHFKCFEELKDIPGLPVTFYQRFMKANNLF